MKRGIFWSVFFTNFLRLQIYTAIAAIFGNLPAMFSSVVLREQFLSKCIYFWKSGQKIRGKKQ